MTSIIVACLWVLLAQAIAFLPSRDQHWRAAYGLIALGLPILGWVWWENGWLIGAVISVAFGSILRWPVYYAYKRLRAALGAADG